MQVTKCAYRLTPLETLLSVGWWRRYQTPLKINQPSPLRMTTDLKETPNRYRISYTQAGQQGIEATGEIFTRYLLERADYQI